MKFFTSCSQSSGSLWPRIIVSPKDALWSFSIQSNQTKMRCLMNAWRLIFLPGPLDACPGTVLNHFLPGSISGLGMMWVICFGSISLETPSPASSLQQMVTDCACKVVRLAAIGAHRTVFVLSLPVNTGVFTELRNLTCRSLFLARTKAEKLTLHFDSCTLPCY